MLAAAAALLALLIVPISVEFAILRALSAIIDSEFITSAPQVTVNIAMAELCSPALRRS